MPPLLPVARCALTAPFHPYPIARAVYFLWHLPSAHAAQELPGALAQWSPDFPLGRTACNRANKQLSNRLPSGSITVSRTQRNWIL